MSEVSRGTAISIGSCVYSIRRAPEIPLSVTFDLNPRSVNGSVVPSASSRSGTLAPPAAMVAASAARFISISLPASRLTTSRSARRNSYDPRTRVP